MPVDPAVLQIVRYPDPVLREVCQPVKRVTDEVRRVARRMIELMDEAEGIGLAAPQVALPWRLFVTRVPVELPEDDGPIDRDSIPARVFINPVLSSPTGSPTPMNEGCLSIPSVRGDVLRPPTITIEATDLDEGSFTHTATGLVARCWQHEFDHIEGILILDRFTQMSRLRNRAAIRALERGR